MKIASLTLVLGVVFAGAQLAAAPVVAGSAQFPLPIPAASSGHEVQRAVSWQDGGDGRIRAPMQNLEARVVSTGMILASADDMGSTKFGWELVSLGRADELRALSPGQVLVNADDSVSLIRPSVSELFTSGPDGIRQEFIVQDAPAGDGPLTLELYIDGARLRVGKGVRTHALTLVMSDGRELDYHAMQVTDADGRVLGSWMHAMEPTRLRLEVDDSNARYPIAIAPIFSDPD